MSEFDNIKKDILESAKKMGQSRTSGYDTTATVTRIEGSTAWVHIPGGVIETPAQLTISAKAGDAVQVRVADGSAWITGNATAPPTDDRTAVAATVVAQTAQQAADTVSAKVAVIEKAYITEATVETLLADYASIDYLEANYATITELHTGYAQINLANIDTANISKASIKDLFTEVGLIASATIVDGKITGYLDAVNVNAANITAGTLVADRIAIRGSNSSLVYALNNYGQITSTQVNTLDGYVLTPRTINADKIVAGTITATEIAASTITANKLNVSTLSSVAADIGTVTAGVLKSTDYSYSSGTYTTAGMIIDLTNKVIRMPNTAILSDGSLYTKSGEIGGFAMDSTSIHTKNVAVTSNAEDSLALSSSTFTRTIGGTSRSNLKFAIGDSFGLTKAGQIFAGATMILDTATSSSGRTSLAGIEIQYGGTAVGGLVGSVIPSSTPYKELRLYTPNQLHIYAGEGIFAESAITGSLTGHASLDLPLTGGTLTGNVTIGQTTDTYVRTMAVRNSLGNVSLAVGGDGLHGIWSDTKGGWLLYANSSASSTDNNLYIPRTIWCSAGRIFANMTSGEAQVNASNGTHTIYLYCNSNGTSGIYAFKADGTGYSVISTANGATTSTFNGHATSDLPLTGGTLTGALTVTGTLTGYDYSGASHVMVGSAADASHRVGYLYHQNPTTVRVYGQAGGSGYTTYTTLTGTSSSDIRLKKNVADTEIANALSVINQIEMRSFDWLPGWRDYDHQPIGMIADQIEKLDNRLVIGGGYDPDGEPNYKVIDDHYLACYLTKGVQELCDRIEMLEREIKALKGVA